MPAERIEKRVDGGPGVAEMAPNLADYDAERRSMSWQRAGRELDGLPAGGLNIAHEAVDRHAAGAAAGRVAIRAIGKAGDVRDLTYGELSELSSRFANVLRRLGVGAGERVFTLAGRVPELYAAALGTLKNRSVFCPLFSSFGPEPIHTRLALGGGRVLVTTAALYRRKVETLRSTLPELEHVLLIGGGEKDAGDATTLQPLLDAAEASFEIPPTDPEDPALLHFTSGTSGEPKGALHVHGAVVAHHYTGKLVLDLRPGDVYWCTADPGWVTGTSYGIIAPLACGATMIVDEEEFDAARWYDILEREEVNVWYTAPTAIRMLKRLGTEVARRHRFPRLRFLASVGEPLDAEAVAWGVEAFGRPFHDTWWQTETGAIMIANYAAVDVKPGSMGRPLPGIEAEIVRRLGAGPRDGVEVLEEPDVAGELALRAGWPSMFQTYLGEEERYRECFRDGWYLTGDLARRDADGYFWFVGRAGDAIKSAGHLIGPFEVEAALLEHPAVAEVGVIGRPDPMAGEVVKAFVVLRPGQAPDRREAVEALRRDLRAHARKRLGPAVAPREIEFRPDLPKTRSGKILRRVLKARELGLPEGDLSTLEPSPPAKIG